MQVLNRTSRYDLVIQTASKMAVRNPKVSARAEELLRKYRGKLREHRQFIHAEGFDPAEITDWKWQG
jgi:xylulose-5-phosphate/fructose-6-phosphate phosphoketolase